MHSDTHLVLRFREERARHDGGPVERIPSAVTGLGGRFFCDLGVPRSGSKLGTIPSVACLCARWPNSNCCIHLQL